MDQHTLSKVQEISEEVRDWTEQLAEKKTSNKRLAGYCAIASARLHKELGRIGINAELHVWNDPAGRSAHVFVVVDDYVIDVTATQFQQFINQPIVIMHHREAETYPFYNSSEIYKNSAMLRKAQLRQGWTIDQVAFA
jgi:hypothetical protein